MNSKALWFKISFFPFFLLGCSAPLAQPVIKVGVPVKCAIEMPSPAPVLPYSPAIPSLESSLASPSFFQKGAYLLGLIRAELIYRKKLESALRFCIHGGEE